MLRAAFVQVANTLQLAQHVGRHIVADALGMTKLQIQHRLAQVGSAWLFASTSPAPPSSSDCFSCCSSQPAISLLARRFESTHTEAPVASRFGAASAWIETRNWRLLTRHVRAAHHRNKVIPVAGQHRLKLRIGVQ